jgi:hypothetical protein
VQLSGPNEIVLLGRLSRRFFGVVIHQLDPNHARLRVCEATSDGQSAEEWLGIQTVTSF